MEPETYAIPTYSATLQHDAERIGRGKSSDAIRGCEFNLKASWVCFLDMLII